MDPKFYSLVAIVVLFGASINADTDCDERQSTESMRKCYGSDDPHFKTFDSWYYDFHGTCVYKYVASCEDGNYDTSYGLPYQVSVEQKACNNGASCVETVYIKFSTGDIITIPTSTGIPTSTSTPIVLPSGQWYTITAGSPTRFEGYWNDLPSGGTVALMIVDVYPGIVEIYLSECILEDEHRVCGLCGLPDYDTSNEYHIIEGGSVVTVGDAYTFGNFWCDPDFTDCGDCGQTNEDEVFEVKEECGQFSKDCCYIIWAEYCRHVCRGQDDILNFDTWMEWCMFDGCAAVNNEMPDGVDCNLAMDEYFDNPIDLCMTVCDNE